jgi:hypothetical protein
MPDLSKERREMTKIHKDNIIQQLAAHGNAYYMRGNLKLWTAVGNQALRVKHQIPEEKSNSSL